MAEKQISPMETLTEIRQLMERSSTFISLSGLSGVFAGVYALAGAYAAYAHLGLDSQPGGTGYFAGRYLTASNPERMSDLYFLLTDAAIVLVLAIATGIYLTTRKAKKDGNSIFDSTAKKLVINLCIPLIVGGLFCAALLVQGSLLYIAPSTLVFYGLALLHASKYTRHDVRNLGLAQIGVGLVAMFMLGYGLLFWAIGFGLLHILYGTIMYFKYER